MSGNVGEFLATLETLKDSLGVKTDEDDHVLSHNLATAHKHICNRVKDDRLLHPDVQEAIILLASRLYKRRQSPEGVAGWNEMGIVRIMRTDPDISTLLELHLDVGRKVLGLA